MKRVLLLLWGLFSLSGFNSIEAKELRYLARSPRALLMGDAYTAIADDEFTLFYNPAALGKGDQFQISPLTGYAYASNIIDEQDKFDNIPTGDYEEIANRFLGEHLHLSTGTIPSIKFGSFGFALIAQSSTSMSINNPVNPSLAVDYRFDRGFVFGFAHDIYNRSKNPRGMARYRGNGKSLSLGVSFKYLTREGLDQDFDLFSPKMNDIIFSSDLDYREIRDKLGYSEGQSWGVDFGIDFGQNFAGGRLNLALSVLDISDTTFDNAQGEYEVPGQDMMINSGLAFTQGSELFSYTLSADIHPLNHSIAFERRLHFGLKLKFPMLSFYGGYNAGYLSYGAELELFPFKILAGFYDVEVAQDYRQQREQRGLIFISLFDISFDN